MKKLTELLKLMYGKNLLIPVPLQKNLPVIMKTKKDFIIKPY